MDASPPRVRPATTEDAADLAWLRWTFRDELGMADEPFDRFRDRFVRFVAEALGSGTWAAFVADASDRLVGTAYVQMVRKVPVPNERERHAFAYVTNVYVDPELRGSGIGARLVGAAVAWARERAPDAAILWPNPESMRFWERAGFARPEHLLEMRLDG